MEDSDHCSGPVLVIDIPGIDAGSSRTCHHDDCQRENDCCRVKSFFTNHQGSDGFGTGNVAKQKSEISVLQVPEVHTTSQDVNFKYVPEVEDITNDSIDIYDDLSSNAKPAAEEKKEERSLLGSNKECYLYNDNAMDLSSTGHNVVVSTCDISKSSFEGTVNSVSTHVDSKLETTAADVIASLKGANSIFRNHSSSKPCSSASLTSLTRKLLNPSPLKSPAWCEILKRSSPIKSPDARRLRRLQMSNIKTVARDKARFEDKEQSWSDGEVEQLDESSNLSALDLYTDLLEEAQQQEKPLQTTATLDMNNKLKEEMLELRKQLEQRDKILEKITKQNEILRQNISAIMKTAQLELKTKHREILSLELRLKNGGNEELLRRVIPYKPYTGKISAKRKEGAKRNSDGLLKKVVTGDNKDKGMKKRRRLAGDIKQEAIDVLQYVRDAVSAKKEDKQPDKGGKTGCLQDRHKLGKQGTVAKLSKGSESDSETRRKKTVLKRDSGRKLKSKSSLSLEGSTHQNVMEVCSTKDEFIHTKHSSDGENRDTQDNKYSPGSTNQISERRLETGSEKSGSEEEVKVSRACNSERNKESDIDCSQKENVNKTDRHASRESSPDRKYGHRKENRERHHITDSRCKDFHKDSENPRERDDTREKRGRIKRLRSKDYSPQRNSKNDYPRNVESEKRTSSQSKVCKISNADKGGDIKKRSRSSDYSPRRDRGHKGKKLQSSRRRSRSRSIGHEKGSSPHRDRDRLRSLKSRDDSRVRGKEYEYSKGERCHKEPRRKIDHHSEKRSDNDKYSRSKSREHSSERRKDSETGKKRVEKRHGAIQISQSNSEIVKCTHVDQRDARELGVRDTDRRKMRETHKDGERRGSSCELRKRSYIQGQKRDGERSHSPEKETGSECYEDEKVGHRLTDSEDEKTEKSTSRSRSPSVDSCFEPVKSQKILLLEVKSSSIDGKQLHSSTGEVQSPLSKSECEDQGKDRTTSRYYENEKSNLKDESSNKLSQGEKREHYKEEDQFGSSNSTDAPLGTRESFKTFTSYPSKLESEELNGEHAIEGRDVNPSSEDIKQKEIKESRTTKRTLVDDQEKVITVGSEDIQLKESELSEALPSLMANQEITSQSLLPVVSAMSEQEDGINEPRISTEESDRVLNNLSFSKEKYQVLPEGETSVFHEKERTGPGSASDSVTHEVLLKGPAKPTIESDSQEAIKLQPPSGKMPFEEPAENNVNHRASIETKEEVDFGKHQQREQYLDDSRTNLEDVSGKGKMSKEESEPTRKPEETVESPAKIEHTTTEGNRGLGEDISKLQQESDIDISLTRSIKSTGSGHLLSDLRMSSDTGEEECHNDSSVLEDWRNGGLDEERSISDQSCHKEGDERLSLSSITCLESTPIGNKKSEVLKEDELLTKDEGSIPDDGLDEEGSISDQSCDKDGDERLSSSGRTCLESTPIGNKKSEVLKEDELLTKEEGSIPDDGLDEEGSILDQSCDKEGDERMSSSGITCLESTPIVYKKSEVLKEDELLTKDGGSIPDDSLDEVGSISDQSYNKEDAERLSSSSITCLESTSIGNKESEVLKEDELLPKGSIPDDDAVNFEGPSEKFCQELAKEGMTKKVEDNALGEGNTEVDVAGSAGMPLDGDLGIEGNRRGFTNMGVLDERDCNNSRSSNEESVKQLEEEEEHPTADQGRHEVSAEESTLSSETVPLERSVIRVTDKEERGDTICCVPNMQSSAQPSMNSFKICDAKEATHLADKESSTETVEETDKDDVDNTDCLTNDKDLATMTRKEIYRPNSDSPPPRVNNESVGDSDHQEQLGPITDNSEGSEQYSTPLKVACSYEEGHTVISCGKPFTKIIRSDSIAEEEAWQLIDAIHEDKQDDSIAIYISDSSLLETPEKCKKDLFGKKSSSKETISPDNNFKQISLLKKYTIPKNVKEEEFLSQSKVVRMGRTTSEKTISRESDSGSNKVRNPPQSKKSSTSKGATNRIGKPESRHVQRRRNDLDRREQLDQEDKIERMRYSDDASRVRTGGRKRDAKDLREKLENSRRKEQDIRGKREYPMNDRDQNHLSSSGNKEISSRDGNRRERRRRDNEGWNHDNVTDKTHDKTEKEEIKVTQEKSREEENGKQKDEHRLGQNQDDLSDGEIVTSSEESEEEIPSRASSSNYRSRESNTEHRKMEKKKEGTLRKRSRSRDRARKRPRKERRTSSSRASYSRR